MISPEKDIKKRKVTGSAQSVIDIIRESIISGRYAPNSFLPPQRILAKELNVGQWLVRMALEQLTKEGLLESSRGRGTRVLPQQERFNKIKIAFVHGFAHGSNGQMPELYKIREGITHRLQEHGYNSD